MKLNRPQKMNQNLKKKRRREVKRSEKNGHYKLHKNELVLDSAPQGDEGLIHQNKVKKRFVTHFMS
jgi:hypothetical protein